MTEELLFAYYGDDVTGSTDALEGLTRNGVRTILFLEPPTPDELDQFDELNAIGVAGRSRSMSPAEMDETLPAVFTSLAELETPLVHYKVCSTFDSSPEIGSIGHAIDLAQDSFDSTFVPLSQTTSVPYGRYVAFGNLFAVQDETTHRIDRHPTMSDHPTTPMTEANLRRHLAEQTDRSIGGVELPALERYETADAALESELDDGSEIIVFDGVSEDHLDTVSRVLWERAETESGPLFAVGSSGFEHHMLPPRWEAAGVLESTDSLFGTVDPVDRMAVVSGSASPVTSAQLEWAADNGFELIRLDTERLVDPETAATARQDAIDAATDALSAGDSVVLYSVDGPDDPAIERTRRRFERVDVDGGLAPRLGRQQGIVFGAVLEQSGLKRACISGGDTSGFVTPELGTYALEPIARTEPGAPLCRVHSHDPTFDGLQITLKGGQTGGTDYFGVVRDGTVSAD